MQCPCCDKELLAPTYAYHNADAYGSTSTVVTECCGELVSITPLRSYRVDKYTGDVRTEDDWGTPVKN